jgi:predicted PhzF superfamily epimerase YddE/YHI9
VAVQVNVLRVFTNPAGEHGNPLGVVLDTTGLDDARRQAIATELNFSETVFIEDMARAELRIFTPARELPLAGHPLVGAAWALSLATDRPVPILRPLLAGSEVETWTEDGLTWIRALIADAPPWNLVLRDTAAEIEALRPPSLHRPSASVPPPASGTPAIAEDALHEYYAWQDEVDGAIRARVFASAYGIAEDEATGSGALRLVEALRRPLVITQGRGSIIYARPAPHPEYAEIGGRVLQDEVRVL